MTNNNLTPSKQLPKAHFKTSTGNLTHLSLSGVVKLFNLGKSHAYDCYPRQLIILNPSKQLPKADFNWGMLLSIWWIKMLQFRERVVDILLQQFLLASRLGKPSTGQMVLK